MKKSSTNGVKITRSRSFTAEDICHILIAARKTQLKELKCGSLHLSFHSTSKESEEEKVKISLVGQPKKTQEDERPGDLILDEEAKEILEEIEAENVMIQDPAEYERRLLDERVFGADQDQGELIGRGPEE